MGTRTRQGGGALWPLVLVAALAVLLGLVLMGEEPEHASGGGANADAAIDQEAQPVAPEDLAAIEPAAGGEARDEASPAEASTARVDPEEPVIDPDARLVIRVVDGEGGPVRGIGLEWVFEVPGGRVRPQEIKGETDRFGLLEVERAGQFLDALFRPEEVGAYAGMGPERAGLRASLPFDEYEATPDDPAPGTLWLVEEPERGVPVEIVLPPTGLVRITWDAFQGAGGELVQPEQLLVLRPSTEGPPRWRPRWRLDREPRESVDLRVGLGWELECDLWTGRVMGVQARSRHAGPTAAGEVVKIHLDPGAEGRRLVRLRGVAHDHAGAVLGDVPLRIEVGPDPTQPFARGVVRSDEDGSWSVQAPLELLNGVVRVSDTSLRPADAADVALPSLGEAQEELDLGIVTLLPPEGHVPAIDLVAGRVVDANGEGLGTGRTYVYVEAHARSVKGEARDPADWVQVARVRTSRDGSFEVRERVELADAMLRVTPSDADHFKAEPTLAAAGEDDLTLTLRKGCSVQVQIDADPWAALTEEISLRFQGEGRDHKPSIMDFASHYRGRFSGLDPGTYRLTVRIHGGEWVLHDEEVVVNGDVDLGRVDLRGALMQCYVAVQDADGRPLEKGWASTRDAATGVEIDGSARIDADGGAMLVVPRGVDVMLTARDGAQALVPASWFIETTLEEWQSSDFDPERHELRLIPR